MRIDIYIASSAIRNSFRRAQLDRVAPLSTVILYLFEVFKCGID